MSYNKIMKYFRKKLLGLTLVFVIICIVFSCRIISEVGTSLLGIQSVSDWNGSSFDLTYDGTWVQRELPKGVRTLNIKANGPIDIFMAKMNVGDTVFPKYSTRYIVSKRLLSAGNQLSADFSNEFDFLRNAISEIDSLKDVSGISTSGVIRKDYAPARDFVPPNLEELEKSSSGRFATDSNLMQPQRSIVAGNLQLGAEKNLWVDLPRDLDDFPSKDIFDSDDITTYTQRPATLRATGKHCYVWVVDGYYSDTGASGSKIDSDLAKELAAKFDKMYEPIRNVFGEESNKMIDSQIVDISTESDTGTKVNIVVYDIENDYTDNQMGGTMGYFWAKDYYTDTIASHLGGVYELTNEGKYFYIDSGFLVNFPEMIYSTLAHEFQHMINFGQKTISSIEKRDKVHVYSQTWSNEMMSMVCEDMVQNFLGIEDRDSPISRLALFCVFYSSSGITDWLGGDSVIYSYAGAYAFGAYLARNYGGTELFNKISTSPYVDQDSITQGLKAINSKETFDTVFEKYVQALLIDNPPTGVDVPSFNKSVDGIGDKMKAIDIFNIEVESTSGKIVTTKPFLLNPEATGRVDLRPKGFSLHHLGYTNSAGTVQLNFSSPVNEDEKIYILVQSHKEY